MGTEEQSANGGGVATRVRLADDHRQPHRADLRGADRGRDRSARTALRDIKVDEDDFGLMTYDPAFMNTASCR